MTGRATSRPTPRRVLLAAVVAGVALLAPGTVLADVSQTFADPSGDATEGAPDIRTTTVSYVVADDEIEVLTQLDEVPLAPDERISWFVDTDGDPATGGGAADIVIDGYEDSFALSLWDEGSFYEVDPPAGLSAFDVASATATGWGASASSLGIRAGTTIRLVVTSENEDGGVDRTSAPGVPGYAFAIPALKPPDPTGPPQSFSPPPRCSPFSPPPCFTPPPPPPPPPIAPRTATSPRPFAIPTLRLAATGAQRRRAGSSVTFVIAAAAGQRVTLQRARVVRRGAPLVFRDVAVRTLSGASVRVPLRFPTAGTYRLRVVYWLNGRAQYGTRTTVTVVVRPAAGRR